jgi:hypothetical protein
MYYDDGYQIVIIRDGASKDDFHDINVAKVVFMLSCVVLVMWCFFVVCFRGHLHRSRVNQKKVKKTPPHTAMDCVNK